jgi:hypothetical protein
MKSSTKPLPEKIVSEKPLTDPIDLLALFGRVLGTLVLFLVSATLLLRHDWRALMLSVPAMFVMQWMTIRFWRKLRTEREEGEKARELARAQSEEQIS